MTEPSSRLRTLDDAIPVLLKVAGAVGFVAAQVIWLVGDRAEPELMAICIGVAAGGYLKEGLNVLRQPSPEPPQPPVEVPVVKPAPIPPAPAPSDTPKDGEGGLWVP